MASLITRASKRPVTEHPRVNLSRCLFALRKMAAQGRSSLKMRPDRKRKPYKNNLWRQNVYEMGNVQEGQGFAAARKLSTIREYKKLLRKNKREMPVNVITGDSNIQNRSESDSDSDEGIPKKARLTSFQKAKEDFKRLQEEKQQKAKEKEIAREERKAALKRYKQKKMAKMKVLNKKTAKGQPALRARMDLILEEIREQIRKE